MALRKSPDSSPCSLVFLAVCPRPPGFAIRKSPRLLLQSLLHPCFLKGLAPSATGPLHVFCSLPQKHSLPPSYLCNTPNVHIIILHSCFSGKACPEPCFLPEHFSVFLTLLLDKCLFL